MMEDGKMSLGSLTFLLFPSHGIWAVLKPRVGKEN